MKTLNLFLMGFVLITGIRLKAQNADEILKKMDATVYAPKDQQMKIKMIIYDKTGKETVREAISIQKGFDRRLFRFVSPPSQAGIGLLSLPNDVMYLYMPAYEKERRIASSAKNQNFAGTDLSYDDMESKLYQNKYDAVSVKSEGNDYILELKPKPDNKTQYSKLIITLGKDNFYPKNVKYFDKNNVLIKELNNLKIEKINNYWTTTVMEMKTIKTNTKTRIEFTEIKFDNGFSDDEFTVRKLTQK